MIVFRPGRVIQGTDGAVLTDVVVCIEGQRITAVESAAGWEPPDSATVVEAPDATLMPGMIDAHVHLAYNGATDSEKSQAYAATNSYPLLSLRAAANAREALRHGFTAVRDLNAPGGVVTAVRNAAAEDLLVAPRIKACGRGLSITGGHMDKGGWASHVSFRDYNVACDGPEAFRSGVRREVREGADFIKINLCGGSLADPQRPWVQEMTDAETTAAIDEAHRRERKVAAHASGGPSIAMAVRAGLDSVEHGHWIDQETAELMAEHGTFYVPTLLINERNFELGREVLGNAPDMWEWLERSREAKWESLQRARSAGVRIVAGTDAGFMLPHGSMSARELGLLVQGGLSELEAIEAATGTAAALLEIQAGEIRAGRLADLLLVDGNPLEDLSLLQDPSRLRIFLAGTEVAA